MENTAKKRTPKQAGKGLLKWVLYLLVMTGIFAILTVVIQGWPLFSPIQRQRTSSASPLPSPPRGRQYR